MHHFNEKITAPFNAEDLFLLIANIEYYPEFIPWCKGLRILKKNKCSMIAEVTIGAFGIHERYISNITLKPLKNKKATIAISSDSKIFNQMKSSWQITKLNDNLSEIAFDISFSINSRIINAIINKVLPLACKKILLSFQKRAENTLKKYNY